MVRRSAVVRLYRPGPSFWRWLSIQYLYYRVFIDGADRGEVWTRQTKTFDVTPGEHEVQLKRGALIKSNRITIAVDDAKELDLACSIRGEVVGWPELRLATPKQSAKMRRIVGKPPTPRNLGAEGRSIADS